MNDTVKMGDIYTYPRLKVYEGLVGKFPIRNPDLYFGIEVEAEKVGHISSYAIPGSWKTVEDGSLKVHGVEYVTVPIKFQYLEVELNRLFQAIPKASFSCRTSIHVHMNARDMTLKELMNFLIIYMIFEKSLYKYAGPDRWKNNFCVPLYSYPNHVAEMIGRLNSGSMYESWTKYHGLNLAPLFGKPDQSARIGTIEFRQMEGNSNIERILNWCNLISSMKNASKQLSKDELVSMVADNKAMPLSPIVFGKWSNLLKGPSFEADIKSCNSRVKYVLFKSGVLINTLERPKPVPASKKKPQTLSQVWAEIAEGEMQFPSIDPILMDDTEEIQMSVPPEVTPHPEGWHAVPIQPDPQVNIPQWAVNAIPPLTPAQMATIQNASLQNHFATWYNTPTYTVGTVPTVNSTNTDTL